MDLSQKGHLRDQSYHDHLRGNRCNLAHNAMIYSAYAAFKVAVAFARVSTENILGMLTLDVASEDKYVAPCWFGLSQGALGLYHASRAWALVRYAHSPPSPRDVV